MVEQQAAVPKPPSLEAYRNPSADKARIIGENALLALDGWIGGHDPHQTLKDLSEKRPQLSAGNLAQIEREVLEKMKAARLPKVDRWFDRVLQAVPDDSPQDALPAINASEGVRKLAYLFGGDPMRDNGKPRVITQEDIARIKAEYSTPRALEREIGKKLTGLEPTPGEIKTLLFAVYGEREAYWEALQAISEKAGGVAYKKDSFRSV